MTSSEIMVITMIERDASSARSFFPFSFFVFFPSKDLMNKSPGNTITITMMTIKMTS